MLRNTLRTSSLLTRFRQTLVRQVAAGHAACNLRWTDGVRHNSSHATRFPQNSAQQPAAGHEACRFSPRHTDLDNPSIITRFTRTLAGQAMTRRHPAHTHDTEPHHAQQRRRMTDGSPSVPPYELYTNARRLQSIGLTTFALGQAGFWASATNLTATNLSVQVADPLIGPAWTILGFGLSAAFTLMICGYLRRSVAHLHVRNGPVIRVVARNVFGMLAAPVDVEMKDLVAGRFSTNGRTERHWSFGVKLPSGRTFFYILDMNAGVVDRDAILALAKGGEHFMAWSLKRDALAMKQRWQEWRDDAPRHT